MSLTSCLVGEHEYVFRISDNRLNSDPCKKDRDDPLVDSGATTHIINKYARFKTFNNSFDHDYCHTIELADGSKSKIAGARGTAHIEL